MSSHKQSLFFLHTAVLLFGGTALFAKLIHLPALDITVYRTAIAAFALVIMLGAMRQPIALRSTKDYLIALALGAIVGVHWVTYFAGMQLAGITIGIIAFFSYPVLTVMIEPLFHRALPKLKDMISAIAVSVGIYLLIPEATLGNDVTLGIATGVFSALCFALRNILQRQYFNHYGGPQTMFYQTLVASLMLCAFVEVPPMAVTQRDIALLFLVAIVFTATPHALFAASLRQLSATTAGLISCLQPLYATILAFILLQERPDIATLIGGMLVVSAAFFETWSVSRQSR
ncbi:EamA/RhaT family transporter [Pseudoalteromonas ruthenica]|uniref:EamA/RhaT family transporter n=1 Tax=Pseudoalteromonas ruthenica TaxID=151081 RepID=A0A5S3Z347_9GAMM|nr:MULTISPECIES: DMT family transporter [Pseudoalteromonas]MCF2862072.1 DMT family transporter [Pseudoalteromonas sp. CNAT2-18]MCG7558159.1 DMT family transporter [Pseudoalteromonas sp. CNAT2-18.1]MCG7566476.1 DMT family transporter [Pseudoalteromonas sp. CnMc7-15]MCG7569900.1 DMT family transporter [Pseudoalteromonas sp. CNC9-20]TMP86441.1 EamA/RhaT family transporter [Pseudoalteromonas ruthenica]|tara:strand:+ start:73924 stop:74787 length:864 start_codon:yes stop_codon:yes gene_type:complete